MNLLIVALTFLYILTPSFATPDYGKPLSLSKRHNANVGPRLTMPIVTIPQDASPIVNGTVLPPYSTVYYFDQVTLFLRLMPFINELTYIR
jgi:hypothetical protein